MSKNSSKERSKERFASSWWTIEIDHNRFWTRTRLSHASRVKSKLVVTQGLRKERGVRSRLSVGGHLGEFATTCNGVRDRGHRSALRGKCSNGLRVVSEYFIVCVSKDCLWISLRLATNPSQYTLGPTPTRVHEPLGVLDRVDGIIVIADTLVFNRRGVSLLRSDRKTKLGSNPIVKRTKDRTTGMEVFRSLRGKVCTDDDQ